ncbi:unnamed protein product [Rhizophagus irregularis]|nr:unnamed protein product [Rhizophagus irregularis]
MTYYNSCVYAASGRKLDENKIIVLDAELENVQIDADEQNISKIAEERKRQNQRNSNNIAKRNEERGKKIQEQKTSIETFDWDKDFVPYGHSVQEKIKAKEFEPTFAKHILDFEKIQKCLACEAFLKYSPLNLCRYYEFCLKYRWFLNKQYIPSSQNQNLIANTPTVYDVLVKMFGYQEFRDMQEMAISSYVNGSHTFVSIHTGAGKTMCYWISAILRRGLTIVISPLVSLIDNQVIETITTGIRCASIYAGKYQPPQYFEKVFSEITIGLIKILYIQ